MISASSGSRTVNIAPCPSPSLSAVDRAAVQLDQVAHDREPEPQALVLARARRAGLAEALEDVGQEGRRRCRCRCRRR